MIFETEFKKTFKHLRYSITNKMYYKVKAFKVSPVVYSSIVTDEVLVDNSRSYYLLKAKTKYKNLFKNDDDLRMFVHTIRHGSYFKTYQDVIHFLDMYKTVNNNIINPTLGPVFHIHGPRDDTHLEELKNLQYGKKTEINGIKLKEVLKTPTHIGYRYKLQGIYHFEKSPKNVKDITEEILTFVEVFGGKENDNIMFTGTIKNILDGDHYVENLNAIRSILRGYNTSLTFTLHYKDHGELLSINFMKNNVSIVSAVEFMK
jgi:hypothetical protein